MTDDELLAAFGAGLQELCKKYGVRFLHEDGHGASYLVRDPEPESWLDPLYVEKVRS